MHRNRQKHTTTIRQAFRLHAQQTREAENCGASIQKPTHSRRANQTLPGIILQQLALKSRDRQIFQGSIFDGIAFYS